MGVGGSQGGSGGSQGVCEGGGRPGGGRVWENNLVNLKKMLFARLSV